MDYKQFMQLMEPEGIGSKESIGAFQEFVAEFPYFQTAQALLAKALHDQQHVRYDRQLKIAAAYCSDRKSLYALIHQRSSPVFAETKSESPFISPGEETRVVLPNEIEDNFSNDTSNPAENRHEEWIQVISPEPVFEKPDADTEIEDVIPDPLSSEDPHEIIRKRLEEIFGKKEVESANTKPVEEKIERVVSRISVTEQASQQKIVDAEIKDNGDSSTTGSENVRESEPKIKAEKEREEEKAIGSEAKTDSELALNKISKNEEIANDPIGRIELEYAMEATILQSIEKLPLLEKTDKPEIIQKEENTSSTQNFFDWLRRKHNSDFGNVEEVHAYDNAVESPKGATVTPTALKSEPTILVSETKENPESTQLIDRFIATAPRIVPSKVEFYSPANQAKKSIIDHEDLVSETLAKIYALQGHLMKARSCYVKLSLLNPEKKAYFAALIQEIDNHYNNPDNQDL